jgi:sialate O-acetylesterase
MKDKIITALCFSFVIMQAPTAQVRLPRLIRDSMILQRDSKINIWGWAFKKRKGQNKLQRKNFKTTAKYRREMVIAITSHESRRSLLNAH